MAYLGALFFIIGKTAFALFLPALAGYIAYAIADRPGIAPGFVLGGWPPTCSTCRPPTASPTRPPASSARSSAASWPASPRTGSPSWKVPTWARGLMPVLVIPLLASVMAGLTMMIVLGKPIGWLMDQLDRRPELDVGRQRDPARHASSA